MASRSITSANSVYMLAISGVFPAPQKLQGYAADAAFETDASDIAELVRGVDGALSAGFVFYQIAQTITIMPNSPSATLFDDWAAAEKILQEKLFASATILIPSVGQQFTCSDGVLTRYVPVPGARRVLQARAHVITWGNVDTSPI